MELTEEEQTLVIELLHRLFDEGFGGEAEDKLFNKLITAAIEREES